MKGIAMLLRSAAVLALLAASPASAQGVVPGSAASSAVSLTAAQRSAAIADVVKKVTDRYVFPDRVPAIVARLNASLAAGRYDTDSPTAFAARVTEDLRAASNDRHMYLNYAPAQFAAASTSKRGGEDSPELQAFWQRKARRDNHGLTEMKILPGNVRYLRIAGFEWVEDQTGGAYDAAMRFLRDGDAVIVDLRGNGGGSHAAVRYLLSHFMASDQLDITFLETGKEPVQSRTLEYLPSGRLKSTPLYVLISKQVGSGAEAFAYDVQQFHLGTLVGATTSGAANNNELTPIAPGFILSCSYGRPVHPVSGSNWEGIGVKPDIATDAEQALEVAQSLALAGLLKRTDANPADRSAWTWARFGIEARLHPPVLSQAQLRAMAGQYGEQRVLWRDGALYYARRSGQAARLIPLTADGLFTVEGYDDHLHIRLTGDAMETQWNDEPAPTRLPRSSGVAKP
ncbi:S41 family peptidase [Sphingomonas psychrotolerans]|uniref:Peptidase S41 n=1 Tax=Sphingomonas psychrotolerans TaxID=1327635 RepID=A0A2K8MMX4_9SPHN|nr:S41 family peptidase [Sphingomonas psychrotolerans]ATY34026.1 peptidase S41 [Sphingomonas psychrotolerans]